MSLRLNRLISHVAAGCLLLTAWGNSQAGVAGHTFYQEKSQGWFWYEDPPEEIPEEAPPEPEPPVAVTPPSDAAPEPDAPSPGSVAWIRATLPMLRDKAIENPTTDNVQAYYYAQRLMLDMSERFARKTIEVIAHDPYLDEDLRSPASNLAGSALAENALKERDQLLSRISEKSAILFFFNGSDCVTCGATIASLQGLQHRYGFAVLPISMDGQPLPGGAFQDTQYDDGLAEHLGIITAPALALATPPHGAEVIGYSSLSMDAASHRILTAALRQGLVSSDELARTSQNTPVGLIDNTVLHDLPSEIAENPAEFIDRMRDEARRAFGGIN